MKTLLFYCLVMVIDCAIAIHFSAAVEYGFGELMHPLIDALK